ncbi:MAG: dNTP triphosphohydrolase [Alphaproteobacteria bacterium]|jgi:dGTPase|nr:dNTP triphosphohydrolase [Alphaproteobacteria bacterium]
MSKQKMSWDKLLSPQRVDTPISSVEGEKLRSPYLVDVDRMIYSSHFRTLQDKTQVYPLAKSDYVRTRLTHSLEVGGVGRSLGFAVGEYIINKYKLKNITVHDIGYILQAVGLAHDIGNPPFGHLGEESIKEFFKERKEKLLQKITEEQYNNLISFDGNSQGFRIITNLAGWDAQGGFRLTYATLAAFCKYPRSFVDADVLNKYKEENNLEYVVGGSKSGIFLSEKEIFDGVASEVGLIRLIEGQSIFFRHPLAFLLESADDICYCVADIEDAFFINLISLKEAESLLAPIARSPNKYEGDARKRTSELRTQPFYKKMDDRKKIEWLRGKAISNLIEATKDIFIENEELILKGEFNNELLKLTIFAEEIKECKSFAQTHIYSSHDKTSGEITGIEAITGVMIELCNMIDNFSHPKSVRINRLLNRKLDPKKSYYENLVSVVDIISEFTDRNILAFLKVLKGT